MSASAAGLAALLLSACQEQPAQRVVTVPTQVCDTRFRVSNQYSGTVERLYFSHSSQGAWGTDQLGRSVLAPRRFANDQAANAGAYDFRVVWTNGRATEIRQVNVCRASRITVTDRGLVAS